MIHAIFVCENKVNVTNQNIGSCYLKTKKPNSEISSQYMKERKPLIDKRGRFTFVVSYEEDKF